MSFSPYDGRMQVRPTEKWFVNAPNGDAVFADPFVTEAELISSPDLNGFEPIALDPKTPPPVFEAHPTYQNGFDFFRNIKVLNSALQIGVLLTGAEVASDVGDQPFFESMIAQSDVVIVGLGRGVVAEATGRLTLPEGVAYQKAYTDHILEVAADHRKPIRFLDSMIEEPDGFQGTIHPPIEALLQGMRQKVIDEGRNAMHPSQYLKADRAYRNQKQWQVAGMVGDMLFEAHNEMELNDMAVVMLPTELLDVPRRLVALGMSVEDVGVAIGDERLNTEEFQQDALIFQNGRISAREV